MIPGKYWPAMIFLLGILALPQLTLAQSELSAKEIVERADNKFRGESSKAVVDMSIIRPSWDRTISMKIWSLDTDYSMVYITAPARDEGTAYLNRDQEIWNWVPRISRVVKLPPSMMSQSWMGSDFTNDDLVKQSSIVTDYDHEIVGDSTVSGIDCYEIKLTPKPDAPVVWNEVRMWISKQEFLQLRTEFYDEFDELINVMEGSEIETLDGRTLPTKLSMIPQDKEGHRTVLKYHDINFGVDLSKNFFTVQNMKRVQ
jgi:outer membrane lipoprotein-sorting protein